LAKRRLELVDLAGQGDLRSLQGISAQVGDLAEQIVRGSLADGRQVTDAHVDRLDEAVERRLVKLAELGVRARGEHESPVRALQRQRLGLAVLVEVSHPLGLKV